MDFNPCQNYSTPPVTRQVQSLRGMGNRHSRDAPAQHLVQQHAQLPSQSIITKMYACFQVLTTVLCKSNANDNRRISQISRYITRFYLKRYIERYVTSHAKTFRAVAVRTLNGTASERVTNGKASHSKRVT